MNHLCNMSLTSAESERLAYISGDIALANSTAHEQDLEDLQDAFDEQLEKAKAAAFAEGKAQGLGEDATEQIAQLESEALLLKSEHQHIRDHLEGVARWLRSVGCKTIKQRSEYERALRPVLKSIPRYLTLESS